MMNPLQIFQTEHKALRYNRVDHGSAARGQIWEIMYTLSKSHRI
jgi:hypothetical protein